ncbi:MAG: hypothetical protein ACREL7_17885, partial [Longimicrobiales bacterium]
QIAGRPLPLPETSPRNRPQKRKLTIRAPAQFSVPATVPSSLRPDIAVPYLPGMELETKWPNL